MPMHETGKALCGVRLDVVRSQDAVWRDAVAGAAHVGVEKERRGMRERGFCGVPAAGEAAERPSERVGCLLSLLYAPCTIACQCLTTLSVHRADRDVSLYLAAAWHAERED